jgi:hypothetical protein
MILISHRGNINGSFEYYENEPTYIDLSVKKGYDVEVDVWCIDNMLFLGHDDPKYGVDLQWFKDRLFNLWIHCKNIDALSYLKESGYQFNYFWHQEDDVALTSLGFFWTYPGKKLTTNSIAVMPEKSKFENLSLAKGVCSDFIEKYRK